MDRIAMFCSNLEKTLRNNGMKQKELAFKVRCSEQTISAYIKTGLGKSGKRPSFEMAIEIAEALGLTLDEMCGMKAESAEEEYKTLGDIARGIDKIATALDPEPDETSSVEVEPYGEEYGYPVLSARLNIFNPHLVEFYKKRKQMDELRLSGTIDGDIYSAWLMGELTKLDSMEVEKSEEAE